VSTDSEGEVLEPEGSRLEDQILEMLENVELSKAEGFFEQLEKLEQEHGEEVYTEALYAITRLHFPPDEAHEHFQRIREHCQTFRRALGRETNFRVALLDYFVEVNRRMHNPIVLEIRIFRTAEERAFIDELTRLNNYRAFKSHLRRELHRAERYRTPLSLIILDIDDFKQYNDRHGHALGNEALSEVADLLRLNSREVDIVCRYGGEEFTMILPETDRDGAYEVAQRVRRCVESHIFPSEAGQPGGRLTISGGLSTYGIEASTEAELVSMADQALYVAKGSGKNRIEVANRERRAYVRVNADFTGTYWVVSTESRPFVARNISEGGILFSTDRPISVGSMLKLHASIPGERRAIECAARVVRVEMNGERGQYEVGACFIGLAPEQRRGLSLIVHRGKDARNR
jgi:diguanylate cyclase (GGDEF)-like protein